MASGNCLKISYLYWGDCGCDCVFCRKGNWFQFSRLCHLPSGDLKRFISRICFTSPSLTSSNNCAVWIPLIFYLKGISCWKGGDILLIWMPQWKCCIECKYWQLSQTEDYRSGDWDGHGTWLSFLLNQILATRFSTKIYETGSDGMTQYSSLRLRLTQLILNCPFHFVWFLFPIIVRGANHFEITK